MDPAMAIEVMGLSQQRAMNEAIEKGGSDIQKFFSNSTIFITGGSGFIGKQLIEKLLRSCRDIKKIYILLRPKKGKSIQERFSDILNDPVFEVLRRKEQDYASKLLPVSGDISVLKLGIDKQNWDLITEQVDVIFHVAATINFMEPIKVATLANIRGTREALQLGKACNKLRSFVHVSTAYSHATRDKFDCQVLDEFYQSPVPPDAMIEMAEAAPESILEEITPSLIKKWPNTYAFTKAIAEELVRTKSGDMPVCIVRPSIVICSYHEPLPGWLDVSCVYGPSGMLVGTILGAIHVQYSDLKVQLDLIPVDHVNNVIIAGARETAIRYGRGEKETRIYTVTSNRNSTSPGSIREVLDKDGRSLVTSKALWYCFGFAVKYKILFTLLSWYLHLIPAYLVDGILEIVGKKPQAVKLYKKVYNLSSVLSYFMLNSWHFCDTNTQMLYEGMSEVDRVIYNFNVKDINWSVLIITWLVGIRKYIIKDGLKNTREGTKMQAKFKIIHYIVISLYTYVLFKLLGFGISMVMYMYNMCTHNLYVNK